MLHDATPYVAVNQFNDDDYQDFAVLLEREVNGGPDTLVVFNGPFSGASTASFVVREGIGATEVISYYGSSGFSIDGGTGYGFRVRPTAGGGYAVEPVETGEE